MSGLRMKLCSWKTHCSPKAKFLFCLHQVIHFSSLFYGYLHVVWEQTILPREMVGEGGRDVAKEEISWLINKFSRLFWSLYLQSFAKSLPCSKILAGSKQHPWAEGGGGRGIEHNRQFASILSKHTLSCLTYPQNVSQGSYNRFLYFFAFVVMCLTKILIFYLLSQLHVWWTFKLLGCEAASQMCPDNTIPSKWRQVHGALRKCAK